MSPDLIALIESLVPELQIAIGALIKAIEGGRHDEARHAYEAALRASFIARQK
jgi:hypothetical protein